MHMTKRIKQYCWALGLIVASYAHADHAVIVNPKNTASIGKEDVAKLFLGKTTKFPDGQLAIPINQPESSPTRAEFGEVLLGKTPSQMKSYWSRLIFTGKAVPIKEVQDDAEVVELVSGNPDAIGYVDSGNVGNGVKVLFTY